MSAILNLSAITFTADQLRDLNELVVKATLESPDLTLFHSTETGIKNDREIGIVPGTLGLIGKAAQGCDPSPDTVSVIAALKTWSPKRIEVILRQCVTEINTTLIKLALKLGVNVNDLTNTAYFAFLQDLLSVDIPKMILRHAWMGNQDAMAVDGSPAGVLTSGTDEDYFNVINGFFYQLGVIYAGDANRRTTISENAQATTATQFSELSTDDVAGYLNGVIDGAKSVLGMQPDRQLLVTDSIFKRAYRYLQGKGLAYDIKVQQNGFKLGEWDGIPMYSVPLWDEWISAYENNGTKLNSPHRIVYTTKSNLVVGMEGTTLFDGFNIFYDNKSRYNYIEASDAFDVKVMNDELVQVGI